MKTNKGFKRLLIFLTILVISLSFSAVAAEKKPVTKKKDVKEAPKSEEAAKTPVVEQQTQAAESPSETTSSKSLDPKDARSLIYLDTKGSMAGTGDVKKSGVASTFAKLGAGWHPVALAETGLPMDKYKLVDWAKVVKEKIIDPPYSLDPDAKPADEQILDMDILFETKSDFMDNVIFPHYIHTWWLKCEICHESVGGPIFEPVAGGNDVMMVEMAGGKWCGRCHNRIAFPLADCKRCHVSPKNAKVDENVVRRTAKK